MVNDPEPDDADGASDDEAASSQRGDKADVVEDLVSGRAPCDQVSRGEGVSPGSCVEKGSARTPFCESSIFDACASARLC